MNPAMPAGLDRCGSGVRGPGLRVGVGVSCGYRGWLLGQCSTDPDQQPTQRACTPNNPFRSGKSTLPCSAHGAAPITLACAYNCHAPLVAPATLNHCSTGFPDHSNHGRPASGRGLPPLHTPVARRGPGPRWAEARGEARTAARRAVAAAMAMCQSWRRRSSWTTWRTRYE